MEFKPKDGDGYIMKSRNKELDWHADFQGEIVVDGRAYFVDITEKTSKSGNPYLMLKMKAKRQQPPESERTPRAKQPDNWEASEPVRFNDDIPF